MESKSLDIGDRVRTSEGDVGTVVHIAKLTVFVQFDAENDDARLRSFLASQLIRIDRPSRPTGPNQSSDS
jgi:hypothetical protein